MSKKVTDMNDKMGKLRRTMQAAARRKSDVFAVFLLLVYMAVGFTVFFIGVEKYLDQGGYAGQVREATNHGNH